MSVSLYPGPLTPDNPLRRLPWVLAGALLLVLLSLLGLGRTLLRPAQRPPRKPPPLQAEIYELPASKAANAGTTRSAPQPKLVRPAPATPALPQPHSAETRPAVKIAVPKALAPEPRPARTERHASARPHITPQRKVPVLNMATLQAQIDTAVGQADQSIPAVHDPHTLVARFYLKSLLLKIQRIGNMNRPTNLTGMPVIRLVIGTDGQLEHLTLVQSSGSDRLDRDALQIARESAPFAPFPDKLKRQTQHLALVCYMRFLGYRQLYPGY